MKKFITVILACLFCSFLTITYIVSKDRVYLEEVHDPSKVEVKDVKSFPVTKEALPKDLVWQNGSEQNSFASPKAKKGGTHYQFLMTYPPNFRQIGPDSNSGFRTYLDENDMGLIDRHPETDSFTPALAKEWAVGKDLRTVYFKLDPQARWSDGHKVTADDFICKIKMMRSPGIIAPWYNNHYSKQVEDILKFDDYTIAVRLPKKKADLILNCNMTPMPHHYYGNLRIIKKKYPLTKAILYLKRDKKEVPSELLEQEATYQKALAAYEKNNKQGEKPTEPKIEIEVEDVEENWIRNNDWQIQPRTGAYNIHSYIKGKNVVFSRNKNWWAKDKKLYKGRYNVDKIHFKIIRDNEIAFEHFKKGRLDVFGLTLPIYWHSKAKYLEQVDKGYMTKVWYYNDRPRSSRRFSFNMTDEALNNRDLRIGLSYAINLQEMIDTVLRGDYTLAKTHADGYGKFSHPTLKARSFNPEKAIEYFNKAGYTEIGVDGVREKKDGQRLSFKVLYASSIHTERLLVVQSEARKLGLELKLDQFDQTAVFKAMLDKKHQIAWHGWGAMARPSYWGTYHKDNANKKKNNNFANLDDDVISKLIDEYRFALNEEIKVSLAHKIEERLYELAPDLPTYTLLYFRQAVWRWVKFPEWVATKKSESVVDSYGLFWIDDDIRKETLKAMKEGKIFYNTPKLIKVTRENGKTTKTIQ